MKVRFNGVLYSMNSLKIRKKLESNHLKESLGTGKLRFNGRLGNTALYLMKKNKSVLPSQSQLKMMTLLSQKEHVR